MTLEILLADWYERLRAWSAGGSLASAAPHALAAEQPVFGELVGQWALGNFSLFPPITLLPASSMHGAAGAYPISAGSISLNQDWTETADSERVLVVLSEELGHHLDGLLNSRDTPGDEVELFAVLLHGNGGVSSQQRLRLGMENDHSSLVADGRALAVEEA